MTDWEHMHDFAIHLIQNAIAHINPNIFDQRIAILQLDQASELLTKAYLLKEGYVISTIDKRDISKGIKKSEILNHDKTLSYPEALDLVCKNIDFNEDNKKRMKKFHEVRNEIQHRAINITMRKDISIMLFYPYLIEIYGKLFPQNANLPEIPL